MEKGSSRTRGVETGRPGHDSPDSEQGRTCSSLRIQGKPWTASLKKKGTFSQNAACKFREFMEAPDSVPGTPRGGEPRRPLPLHQARLPAAPSAGGPALIVLVPQGPGELRQADWLPCSPCRPSQVGSARLHPAPLSQVCACTPSLFLQMPVALCLQNLSATEAPVLPWLRFPSGP